MANILENNKVFAEKILGAWHNTPAGGHPKQPQPGKVAPLQIEVKVTDMEQYKDTLKVIKFCFAHMRADHREMAEKMLERVYEQ